MNIQIKASSELMENNKQADIMSPQKQFQALQTKEGHSLFFSIGTDDVFYLTREIPGSESGWKKIDLSSALSKFNGGIDIVVKTFQVIQNIATNHIDIIIAIKGEKQDLIYTSLNLLNEDATWSGDIKWSVQAYDNPSIPENTVEISNLYLTESDRNKYIVVDILKDPSDVNQFVNRYYLDPTQKLTGQVWNDHDLSANLNADTITSCLGRKSNQLVDGIYTMGKIKDKTELIYTPLYNAFNPAIAANPTRLTLPEGASAISSVNNATNGTALFVSGTKALHYFAYDQQEDGDTGQVVLQHDLFLNVTALYAIADETHIVVWGLNEQGQVFYTKCILGSETIASAWSTPIPILTGVTQIASYLNIENSNNVIFAFTNGTNLVKLIQNPMTSLWEQRNIVLPSTHIDNVLSFNTYTTHVQLLREDNLIAGNQSISITSTSPVSVYINNKFTILSPSIPLIIDTDETGTITILQETQEISCVSYKIALSDASEVIDINPMVKIMKTMESIESGEDLANVTVTNSDGSQQKLVSEDIPAEEKEATALALRQFTVTCNDLPQDGSVQQDALRRTAVLKSYKASEFVASEKTIWGMSFENEHTEYYSGNEALTQFGIQKDSVTNKFSLHTNTVQRSNIGDAIVSEAGDILRFIKNAIDDVKNFFVQVIDGVTNFFIVIAEELYTFVLDSYHTVVSVVEFVFNKIKVFIEDLIKWIGFLFKWKDIMRTHKVLKNVFKRGLEHSVDQVDILKKNIGLMFEDIQERIDSWAGLETTTGSLSEKSTIAGTCPGKDDPQANYGTYHLNKGAGDSKANTTIVNGVSNQLEALLDTLALAVETQGEIFEDAYHNFKTQVIDQIDTLSIGEILKRSIGIIGGVLIQSVENIIDTALDIIKVLMQGVLDLLDAKIDIPVLSWLYKQITGNNLSLLDVVCFALAIPTTLLYKIGTGKTPFPNNDTTTKIINAASWEELQDVFSAKGAKSLHEQFISIMRLTAFASSFAFIGLNVAKKSAKTSKTISILHGICFFTTTAPNLAAGLLKSTEQRWDKIVNEVIYGITSIEKLVDVFTYRASTDPAMKTWSQVTKYIDCTLGVAALVPTFAPLAYDGVKSISGVITNTCWNANRIMTPFAVPAHPEVFVAKMGLIGFYGIGQYIMFWETIVFNKNEPTLALGSNLII